MVSTWLRIVRGDEIASGPNSRIAINPVFKQAAYAWLKQAIPNLTSLMSMQVFASPEPAVDATMQVHDLTPPALSVQWHIDAYMDAFLEASDHGCVTDGEAIHAAALLCGGQETWEQAMADPRAFEDMWPVDDDAEEILASIFRGDRARDWPTSVSPV